MSSFWSKASLLLLGVMLLSSLVVAQTTGAITGNIVDNSGQPLPGVTVEIESPAMQGARVGQSNVNGDFRFNLLPPGTYALMATMESFSTLKQADIKVGLDRTVSLRVTMQAAFEDTVLVTGEAPVIDVTTTTVGMNISAELMEDLPSGRSYQDLAMLSTGAVDGELSSNPSLGGASAAENRYFVDGMDTTDPAFGTFGNNLTYNFIQEIEVKTGGYEAEYGGAMGGIINVVTKSGSNELHGEFFGYFTDDSMTEEGDTPLGGSALVAFTEHDFGADVGGKLIEDKLWYFIAYDRTYLDEEFELPVPGAGTFNEVREGDPGYFAMKLNWQANPSNSLIFNVSGDPQSGNDYYGDYFIDVSDAGYLNPMDPSAPIITDLDRDREQGGINYGINFNSIITPNLLFEFRAAHTETKVDNVPVVNQQTWIDYSGDWTCYGDHTIYGDNCGNGIIFGGAGFNAADTKREREQFKGSFSYFLGNHEFKAGLSYSELTFRDYNTVNGSSDTICVAIGDVLDLAYNYMGDDDGDGILNIEDPDWDWHSTTIGDVAETTGRSCTTDDGRAGIQMPARDGNRWQIVSSWYYDYYNSNYQQNSTGTTEEMAFFLQDDWKVTSNFTLKLGVRYDTSKSTGDATARGSSDGLDFGFGDMFAPRVGFTWDFMNNGRSKLYGHYGTFFNAIPLQINVRAFGNEQYWFYYYTYPDNEELPSTSNPGNIERIRLSGGATTILDGIKPAFEEEVILGTEYEVKPNWAVGVKYIYRSIADVMEDFSFDGGSTYLIGNPGQGLGASCIDVEQYSPETGDLIDTQNFCIPEAARYYRGVEINLRKRFSDNWQLYASLLWSKNEGNYGGLFRQDNGQLDPFITSLFDLPQVMTGTRGLLPNDREWQFKAYGSYRFDFGLTTGFDVWYYDGTPLSKLAYQEWYGDDERFVGNRGEFGRTDSINAVNIHLAYPIQLSDAVELRLIADVFNLFNNQGPLSAEQTWSNYPLQFTDQTGEWDLNADGISEGFEWNPPGCDLAADDPNRSVYCDYINPTWGETTVFQDPLSIRVGFVLSW